MLRPCDTVAENSIREQITPKGDGNLLLQNNKQFVLIREQITPKGDRNLISHSLVKFPVN